MSLSSVKFSGLELRNVAGDWFLWIGALQITQSPTLIGLKISHRL
jgi:hypothetical protein